MDVPGSTRPFPCVDLRLLRAQASLPLVYGVWAAQGHRAVSFSTSWYPSPKSYLTPPLPEAKSRGASSLLALSLCICFLTWTPAP